MQRYCLGLTHSVNQRFLCIFDEGLQSQGPIDTFVQKGRASHYCDFCSKVSADFFPYCDFWCKSWS